MNGSFVVKLGILLLSMFSGMAHAAAFTNYAFPAGLRNVTIPVNVPLPRSLNAAGTAGGPATACSVSPDLPVGLSVVLQASTCKISGTPTASVAQTVYTISATTSAGTSTAVETLTVTPVMNLKYIQGIANYTQGIAIDTNFASMVGSAPNGFAVTSGTLPTGLVLNPVTGTITGTPTAVTAASYVTITASNGSFTSSAALNLAVQAAVNYSSWSNYMEITYTPAGLNANVGNYPLLVKLTSGNFNFAQSLSDISTVPPGTNCTGTGGADIRFTKADGTTDLPFQIERWNSTSQSAEFWVLVPSISAGAPTKIRMYWGKSGQTTTNNATAVFDTANKFQMVLHMNTGGTGSTVPAEYESTPNHYLDTAKGTAAPGVATSLIGLGRNFAGGTVSQCINTNATSVAGFANNGFYTVSAWTKPTTIATGTYYTVIQKNDKQFALQINSANPNVWESAEYNGDSGGTAGATPYGWQGVGGQATSAPTVNNVYYVVGEHDGFYQRLYVNGALIYNNAGSSVSPSATVPTLTGTVTIGRQSESATGRPWLGDLDEIRMHNTVRDSNWIKADYQTQSPTGTAVSYGPAQSTLAPPSGLSYSSNPAVYTVGTAITNNTPTVTGTVDSFMVSPALPAGLSLNKTTGVISGTPTAIAAAANFTVTARNNAGSATVVVNITVGVIPVISSSPANQTFGNVGGNAKFGVTLAAGTFPLRYKWIRNNTDTIKIDSGITVLTDTLTLVNVQRSDSGSYKCRVSNAAGSVVSQSGNLMFILGVMGPYMVHVNRLNSFSFSVPDIHVADVLMIVEDLSGRVVWNRDVKVGADRVVSWNGQNQNGRAVSPGMYLVKLRDLNQGKVVEEINHTGVLVH